MPRFDRDKSRGRSSGRSRDSFTKFEDRDRSRGRGSSRGGRSGGRDFGRSGGRSRELDMHRVICDECGKSCEVPFKPTSSKPIYCSDCFKKHDSKGGSGRSEGSSKVLDEINRKLDKIMEAMDLD